MPSTATCAKWLPIWKGVTQLEPGLGNHWCHPHISGRWCFIFVCVIACSVLSSTVSVEAWMACPVNARDCHLFLWKVRWNFLTLWERCTNGKCLQRLCMHPSDISSEWTWHRPSCNCFFKQQKCLDKQQGHQSGFKIQQGENCLWFTICCSLHLWKTAHNCHIQWKLTLDLSLVGDPEMTEEELADKGSAQFVQSHSFVSWECSGPNLHLMN